jgi:CHU_C Type IX secretion signal domain
LNQRRAIYLLALLLGLSVLRVYSQVSTEISDVINAYTSVSAILCEDVGNDDSVVVASTDGFRVGDTVMLYAVKGAMIGDNIDFTPGSSPAYAPGEDAQENRNTGKYAFMIIREVVNPGNTLVFNVTLDPEFRPLVEGEMVQLIRVPSFRHATVTSDGLTSDSWNPISGTGGVVALFVHGVLTLNGDISVSGRGFHGAPGSTDLVYDGTCSSTDTMLYYKHFYSYADHRAGLKGEGTTDTVFHGIDGMRGKASSINGGGGGNGRLAGGGGGSNFSAGVRGGKESSYCDPGVSVTGGAGGFALGKSGWYYVNDNPFNRGNRIFFGGGGGSGTRISGGNSTDGGDGGGIVVIVADTIVGNGHAIRADGADVGGMAFDGAGGGGGGGGCIILDVAGYQTTLNLGATGGNGGNTSGSDTTGMGGAGGGGIYWLAGDTHPGVVPDFSTGVNGRHMTVPVYDPLVAPQVPKQKDDLVTPLRGFLFNPVPEEFTYCSDVDPDPIVTSEPKGGDGTYTYQWIDSSSTQNFWANIVGATAKDYDPGLLTDTIYYRRIVYSLSGTLADTSFLISVNIHPAITGNTIAAADTVCYGNAPLLFESSASIGGGPSGGTFTYKWQEMPEGNGSFTDLTAVSTDPAYQSPGLTTTTEFRRIAYAGVCVSTSNSEEVKVLESITGNDITPNDTICINTVPDLIDGPVPSNGDQADIRYQWLTSTDPLVMGSQISGETGLNYQSPALSQTTYIRRVVLSGNDNACKDTSAYVEILNVPDISNNTIAASQTVCQENTPDPLTASTPGGGYLGQFTYTWISSTDQNNWGPATGGGDNDVRTNFNPGAMMDGDTTWYRRVVESGGLELVCKDTSEFIVINVLPSISNNVIIPLDDLKCQGDMPELISGSLPGGGATLAGNDPSRVYRWELAQVNGEPGSGEWTHPISGADARDFTDPDLLATDVDRWYQRIVISGPGGQCIDTSNLVHLVVHSGITANAIDNSEAICFNDSRPLRHVSLSGGEDTIDPVYTWRRWLEGETSADAISIGGSDQQAFESGPYTDPANLLYYYDRVVEIGACRDTSNAMQVTVMQLPGGELTDADFPACEKDTVLQVDLNMGALTPEHYVTPWNVYLKDGVHTGIGPGSLDKDMDTMGIVMDTEGADYVNYTYEIESIRYYPEGDDYACISPAANLPYNPVVVALSRRPDPQILVDGAARDSFKVCNTTALLEFLPDNGTLTRWSTPIGSVFFSPGTGQDEYQVSIPNNHDDFGKYRIFVKSEAGDCAGLDSIDLHFFEQPANAYAGEDTLLFLINTVKLKADPPTAGIGTWTLSGGNGIIADENDPNTYVYELGMGEENTFTWTVENGEDEGKCSSTNDVTIVLRNEVKRYNGFSPNKDMSNEYYIMQGLPYADEFSVSFFNSLGNTVRTITQDNVDLMEIDPGLIANGLRDDEMVIWDGLSDNGNPVPAGTYYYVVTFIMYQRDYQTGAITRTDSYEFKDYVVVVSE